jgi:hypothetical protein
MTHANQGQKREKQDAVLKKLKLIGTINLP